MNEITIRIDFANHLKNLKSLIFICAGYYLLIFWAFGYAYILQNWYSHLFILIQIVPTIYIHFIYFAQNSKDKFTIGKNYIIDNKSLQEYHSKDILKVQLHRSCARIAFLPFQNYTYIKVILKNQKTFIITSLLKHNIDQYLNENLEGVVFERNCNYFL